MIITREQPRRLPLGRLLLTALVLLALIAGVLAVPRVHRLVFNDRMNAAIANVSAPFTVAAQVRAVRNRDAEIARLHEQLRAEETRIAERDAHAKALAQTVDQLQSQLSTREAKTSAVQPRPQRSASPFGASGGDDDVRRTAAYWAAMEPDRAAAVVRRSPETYALRVFTAMSPDAAGQILAALPPDLAARLSTGISR